jgi:hypothetical protein
MNSNNENDKQKELTRRELLRKAGKLAYAAPTLTVISLRANAQDPPPPPLCSLPSGCP